MRRIYKENRAGHPCPFLGVDVVKYRKIEVCFWGDSDMLELTPEGKYFYLYVLTNPHTNLAGIYEISKKVMAFETGFNVDTIDKLIKMFEDKGKIAYDPETSEIFVINWLKYNWTNSPKVIKCIIQDLERVKSKKLISIFWNKVPEDIKSVLIEYGYSIDTLSIEYEYPMDTVSIPHPYLTQDLTLTQTQDLTQEQTQAQEHRESSPFSDRTPYKEIIELYHSICKSLPRVKVLNETRKRLIRARWREHPDMSFWEEFFRRIEESDFLTGRVSPGKDGRIFVADFEWIIRPNNFAKILEGRYDNRQAIDRKINIEQEIKKLTQKWGRC